MRVIGLTAAMVMALSGYGCSTTAGTGEPESDGAASTEVSGQTEATTADEETDSTESSDPVDTGSDTDDTTDSTDDEPAVDEGGTDRDLASLDLNGSVPDVALTPPEFLATNFDGSERNQANLLGKPTVMWFFPMAGTPG